MSVVKAQLNRMGSALSRMNSKQRKQLFERWEKSDWVLTLKASEVSRLSLIDENARLALQLESVQKEKDNVQKKANKLISEVRILKQEACDRTMECSSLLCKKEIELENTKMKQHEIQRSADETRQELKQIQQSVCSQKDDNMCIQ